jgi:hypothetical protein
MGRLGDFGERTSEHCMDLWLPGLKLGTECGVPTVIDGGAYL